LSEARKYKLNLTVAHQYVEQMEEAVASAIFGNVGTMITFRVGATDAEVFEKEFAPTFTAEDIVNLGRFQIYLSLMIDGIGSRPFSAGTLAPLPKEAVSQREAVIEYSRANFAQPRAIVEADIAKWYEPIKKPERRKISDGKGNTKPGQAKSVVASQKTSSKPMAKPEPEKSKKIFIADKGRDSAASPLKKTLKEIDEKEAELEMKQIVSPKLSDLLEKLESKDSTSEKKIEKNRPDKSSKNSKSPQKKDSKTLSDIQAKKTETKSKNTRRVNTKTKNSLQDALKRALGDKKPKTTRQNNATSTTKENSKPPVKKKPEASQKKSFDISQKTSSTPNPQQDSHQAQKEVPEDILNSILN